MPLPGLPVDLALVAWQIRSQRPVSIPIARDQSVVVESARYNLDPVSRISTFEQGVVARYGPTTIWCDRLVVNQTTGEAEAAGQVRLTDPEGELRAENLKLNWKDGRLAIVESLRAQLGAFRLSAERSSISPERYQFDRVRFTTCGRGTPFYEIRARRLTLDPGQSGKIERPSFYLLGQRILSLPDRRFAIDPRTEGVPLPSLSIRRDVGAGVTWNAGFLAGPQTNVQFGINSFPNVRPGYGVTVAQSFLPAKKIVDIVTPRNEFSERFGYGYLENINVQKPEWEFNFLRRVRRSASVSTQWNQGVVGRNRDLTFSKPIEFAVESSGSMLGEGGYLAQFRAQTISRANGEVVGRLVGIGSGLLPSVKLARNLSSLTRFDTTIYGEAQSYGWVRGLVGAVYRPHPLLTLSAGVVASNEFGNPRYPTDELFAKGGYVVRGDINAGPTRLAWMSKWDRNRGGYDTEYMISQVAGCFEPFVLYRRFPQEYQIGLRFRLDSFLGLARRREFQRSAPAGSQK